MKTLKESILNRSSHGAKGFKEQRREMIEKWLDEYSIKDYTIKDDFIIDVKGSVRLLAKNLVELPDYIQFGVVKGNFDCSSNKLTSLKGCPKEVSGFFNCSYNKLTSLEGGPVRVGNSFYCFKNNLVSLKGSPREVGGFFDCSVLSNEGVQLRRRIHFFDCTYLDISISIVFHINIIP